MDAIRTENLTKVFDSFTAVDQLNLSVADGEIFGLVGPDGAGKTTTMRLLTAIMDPTAGEGWVSGHHTVREAEAIKEEIGYMSQRFGLYPDLTVMENIDFYADIYGVPRKGRAAKIDRLLSFSNLTPFRKRHAGNLSGGMKQKLALSCALIHRPEILILDEPTAALNETDSDNLLQLIRGLKEQGVTCILISHKLREVMAIADTITVLRDGKTVTTLDVEEDTQQAALGRELDIDEFVSQSGHHLLDQSLDVRSHLPAPPLRRHVGRHK